MRLGKIGSVALMGALVCVALGEVNPREALREIRDFEREQAASARQTPGFDIEVVRREVRERARKAVDGVDVEKVPGAEAYDWAKLFGLLDRDAEVKRLGQRFLASGPAAKERFEAQIMVLDSAAKLEDVVAIRQTLWEARPPSVVETSQLVIGAVQRYLPAIQASEGVEKALEALDRVAELADLDGMARSDDQIAVRQAPMLAFRIERARAELLIDGGRKEEGLATMEAFIRTLDPSVAQHRQATSALVQMKLPGTAAPALNATHQYGNFSGIEALRGKVVLLDFFAHWCGPCIRSFPDLKSLYADLKDDGLEVVAVTTFYGYFGPEKDLSKDVEYAKMAGFIKQHELPWPVVYVERDFYAAHGVSGIPHVTVLDREGKIHKIKVGYTPEGFAQFRREVEKLLGK